MSGLNIIGVHITPENEIVFLRDESRPGTNAEYIKELLNLFRHTGTTDIKFSYEYEPETVSVKPTWTPSELQSTNAGKVMRVADDLLKFTLVDLDCLTWSRALFDVIRDKTEITKEMILTARREYDLYGININTDSVECESSENSMTITGVKYKLKYWSGDTKSGSGVESTPEQKAYIEKYATETVPAFIASDQFHPYAQLESVVMAQYIAKFIIEKIPVAPTYPIVIEPPCESTRLALEVRGKTHDIVINLNSVAFRHVISMNWASTRINSSGEVYTEMTYGGSAPFEGHPVTFSQKSSGRMEGGVNMLSSLSRVTGSAVVDIPRASSSSSSSMEKYLDYSVHTVRKVEHEPDYFEKTIDAAIARYVKGMSGCDEYYDTCHAISRNRLNPVDFSANVAILLGSSVTCKMGYDHCVAEGERLERRLSEISSAEEREKMRLKIDLYKYIRSKSKPFG